MAKSVDESVIHQHIRCAIFAGTDNRLFCPGQNNRLSDGTTGGRIIEIDPRTGEVVFELEVNTNTCASAFHRANRISLYPEGL